MSFCGCAVDLVLGGSDHTEDDDQDRRDAENGKKKERKRPKRRETTHGQTHDDMWMNMFFMRHALRHLEPQCGVNTCVKVHQKICCVRVFCSHCYSFCNFLRDLFPLFHNSILSASNTDDVAAAFCKP